MDRADNEQALAACFAALWTEIRTSERPMDTLDRVRDALDRRSETLAQQHGGFAESSFSIVAVTYETETTQILEARHRDIDASYAIKTMPQSRRDDAHLVQRLRREAEIGMALRHPSLQETSALLRMADGRPGLLQPWMPMTLAARLQTQTPAEEEIAALLACLLGALGTVHANGFVHGDVTPANVFLHEGKLDGARLGDFGITLKIGERPADLGLRHMGSPAYAAPEQLEGAAADPRHDIHAIGRLAERMLHACGSADESLRRFVEACTFKDASKRPSSTDEAARLLP